MTKSSRRDKSVYLALALLLGPGSALADAPGLEVAGALPRTGKLTLQDLEAMKPEKAAWSNQGKQQEVEGVPVGKILTAFGFAPGPMGKGVPPAEKRPGYKKVVLVTSRDGFQAVFSCAELAEEMGATRALLVWKVDGQPLPPEQGPFRLVVLTDKEPSRSAWAVKKIEVIDPAPVPPRSAPARP
jgi:DMSO/TMAO reductase YedYZ molybdopterin-dependent catalytic subunit